jgi:hypothetical protein
MRKHSFYAAIAAIAVSMATFANTLTPGMQSSPDLLSLTGTTLLASVSGPLNSLTFDATYNAAVYSGGSNPFCSTCLTFAYQVTDNSAVGPSSGIIEDLTASDFAGFSTDVGIASLTTAKNGFVTGGTMPPTVGRSLAGPGSVVSFEYPDQGIAANDILPGDHSTVLVIETNATRFGVGLFSAIDGAAATATAFEPRATPEPTSLTLSGLSFLGLALFARRIRRF